MLNPCLWDPVRSRPTFVRRGSAADGRKVGYARAMQEAALRPEYIYYPLTTLVQPVAEMCARAWHFLQQRLEEPSRPVQRTVLKPGLAIRESSRRPSA